MNIGVAFFIISFGILVLNIFGGMNMGWGASLFLIIIMTILSLLFAILKPPKWFKKIAEKIVDKMLIVKTKAVDENNNEISEIKPNKSTLGILFIIIISH